MKGMKIIIFVALSGIGVLPTVFAETCTYDAAAAPVRAYTQAMKEYRFEDAWAALSANMTDGLPPEEWAEGQRKLFDIGQVVIGKLDVRWPQHLDPGSCERRALVPNVLSAKDRFNNQGSVEFELYTVVNEGGSWKIDSQETLFEEADIHRWFPGDEIPDYKGQLSTEDALPGED